MRIAFERLSKWQVYKMVSITTMGQHHKMGAYVGTCLAATPGGN
jgi:hypothetical protein